MGVQAHAALIGNPEYQEFYNFLISEKTKGYRIQGTVEYLEYMRDLRKFACRPFTMLVVAPNGDVFYPCLEIGHAAGNLLQETDLHHLRQQGFQKFGGQPACGNQCHSACALAFAALLERPLSAVREAWLLTQCWLRGY